MANLYGAAFSINPRSYADNLDASIEAMYVRPDRHVGILTKYFFPVSAESETIKMSSVGSVLDLPQESEDEDSIPVTRPAAGYDKTGTLVVYRQKVQITRSFMSTDRFGKGNVMASGLPKSNERLKEYLAAAIFTNAFTSGTGGDSTYLVDDSHAPENSLGATRDNELSGAWSYDNWHALRRLALNNTNERGYPDPRVLDEVLGPIALDKEMREVAVAKKEPDTALNKDAVLNEFTVTTSPFLSSDTAFFGFANETMGPERGMFYASIEDGDIADCKPSDNPDIVWAKRVYSRYTFFFNVACSYIFGSPGT